MSFAVSIIISSAILAIGGCLLFVNADVSHLQLRFKRSPQWWRQRDNDGPQYDQRTGNNNNYPESRQYYPGDSGNVRGRNNFNDNNNYQRSDPFRDSSRRNFNPDGSGNFPGNNYYTGGSDYYSGGIDRKAQYYPSSNDYYPSNGGFDRGNQGSDGYSSGSNGDFFSENGGYNPGNNGNPNFFQGGNINMPGFNVFGPKRPTNSAGGGNTNDFDSRGDSQENANADEDSPVVVPSIIDDGPVPSSQNLAPSSPAFTTSSPIVTTVSAPVTTTAPAVTTTRPPVTTSSAPVTTISPATSTTIQEEKKTTPVMFQPINGTKVISNTAGVPIRLSTSPVSEDCLKCICEAISQCDRSKQCYENGDACGKYLLTEPQWIDVDMPTKIGEDEFAPDAFKTCAFDDDCANLVLQRYMRIYRQDCNSDGVINCYDYAAIHKFGPNGCFKDFSISFFSKLHGCLQQGVDEDQAI